jgi:hypothetical protein
MKKTVVNNGFVFSSTVTSTVPRGAPWDSTGDRDAPFLPD